jgi:hypothetical protein
MAVSAENGVEYFEIFDKEFASSEYCQWITNLKMKVPPNFVLFADNWSVHTSKQSWKTY